LKTLKKKCTLKDLLPPKRGGNEKGLNFICATKIEWREENGSKYFPSYTKILPFNLRCRGSKIDSCYFTLLYIYFWSKLIEVKISLPFCSFLALPFSLLPFLFHLISGAQCAPLNFQYC
jgi:hypothetical protein